MSSPLGNKPAKTRSNGRVYKGIVQVKPTLGCSAAFVRSTHSEPQNHKITKVVYRYVDTSSAIFWKQNWLFLFFVVDFEQKCATTTTKRNWRLKIHVFCIGCFFGGSPDLPIYLSRYSYLDLSYMENNAPIRSTPKVCSPLQREGQKLLLST